MTKGKTHTQQVIAKFKEIPAEKRAGKIKSTLWGLVAILAAVAVKRFVPEAPWWVSVGLLCLGLLTASGEVLFYPAKRLVAMIRDKGNGTT